MYKQITVEIPNIGNQIHIVKDNGNGSYTSFPAQEDNPNYQAYLKWLEEGNTPLPAEEA